jgi:rare lipoprotein A
MLWFIIYIALLITSLVSAANAEEGVASQYGRDSGNRVACGGELDEGALTAAHRTLPCGTRVRVTNESNGQSVTVTVNDRGPFVDGRVIDLTPAAANAIRMGGLARVTLSLSQSGTYWSATTRDIVPAMPSPSRSRQSQAQHSQAPPMARQLDPQAWSDTRLRRGAGSSRRRDRRRGGIQSHR